MLFEKYKATNIEEIKIPYIPNFLPSASNLKKLHLNDPDALAYKINSEFFAKYDSILNLQSLSLCFDPNEEYSDLLEFQFPHSLDTVYITYTDNSINQFESFDSETLYELLTLHSGLLLIHLIRYDKIKSIFEISSKHS